MIQTWKDHGCTTMAGFIMGFPTDTPETIARDIEIIKKELPVDLLQFFYLTPLPGSEDHKNLYEQGVWMNPDMNIYDLEHLTTTHPIMSQEDWERAYKNAWKQFYTYEHVETVLRRAAAKRLRLDKVMFFLLWFHGGMTIEKIHPEEGGFGRRKVRTTRRTGMPIESPLIFYPRRVWEVFSAACRWGY